MLITHQLYILFSQFQSLMDKFTLVLILLLFQALYVSTEPDTVDLPETVEVLGLKGDEILFFAHNATRNTYSKFLSQIRKELQPTAHPVYGMAVLRDPISLPNNKRYFEVKIVDGSRSVTLGIDRTNVYIVGYKVCGRRSYFFRDTYATAHKDLFPDTHQTQLPFAGSYWKLGNRSATHLGFSNLKKAISIISNNPNTYGHRANLVIIIEMVAEAVRFRYIENFMRQTISGDGSYKSELPSATMLDLENNWRALSKAVQEAVDGVFLSTINITNREGHPTSITTVRQVTLELAVMVFVCSRPKTAMPSNSVTGINNYLRMVPLKDTTCTDAEVTVNIVGAGGLCVNVKDGRDKDGNPIILWPCHSRKNQKWTLKKDGTIRSLGKCMTVSVHSDSGYALGNDVVLFNCKSAVRDAKLWSIRPDGTIALANKLLALSGKGGVQDTNLTVERNLYAAYQGWLATTDVEPFVISIISYSDLCLQGGTSVSKPVEVSECSEEKLNQRWAVYGDGSIRKDNKRNLCLTSDQFSRGRVILSTCRGQANQRWVLQADGSILNPVYGSVITAKETLPFFKTIITVSSPSGNPNQKWKQIF